MDALRQQLEDRDEGIAGAKRAIATWKKRAGEAEARRVAAEQRAQEAGARAEQAMQQGRAAGL